MFEPGDEVTPVVAPGADSLAASVIKMGEVYVVREFFPAGHKCPACGQKISCDAITLEGIVLPISLMDLVFGLCSSDCLPADAFRKVVKPKTLVEDLLTAPLGGDPAREKDQPVKRRVKEGVP
jgi:hypothetical protein